MMNSKHCSKTRVQHFRLFQVNSYASICAHDCTEQVSFLFQPTVLRHKIKTNPNMCILMYFKIQIDQPRITRNALKSQIFDLFTK